MLGIYGCRPRIYIFLQGGSARDDAWARRFEVGIGLRSTRDGSLCKKGFGPSIKKCMRQDAGKMESINCETEIYNTIDPKAGSQSL